MTKLMDKAVTLISGKIPESIMLLVVRFALAGVFWRSGRTKIEEGAFFTISENTTLLFANEFHMPFPEVTGMIATVAEHFFPILLVIGLYTRLSATGLLVMTMVIQIFVFPESWWQVHILWAALALALITRGAGLFSVDYLLASNRRTGTA
jgi:putative oxidoreductase